MFTRNDLDQLRETVRDLHTGSGNPRVREIVNTVLDAVYPALYAAKVTTKEWDALLTFLADTELPMMRGMSWVLGLGQLVEENESVLGPSATANAIEGPFHIPDAPERTADAALHEADDGGDFIILTGRVLDTNGNPLSDAVLDVWGTNTEGNYSVFDPSQPKFNCRGKVRTAKDGSYRVFAPMPQPYTMDVGEMGALLEAMGHQIWRPKHLHFTIDHAGYEPLTTQVYFDGDPYIAIDPAVGVKPSLITTAQRHDSRAEIEALGFDRPYFTAKFDFRLQPKLAVTAA